MAEPIYKRKWFKVGVGLIAAGLITFFYSDHQEKKYAEEYPYLKIAEEGLTPELMKEKSPEEIQAPEIKTKEDQEQDTRRRMVYGLSRKYKKTSIAFIILGVIIMLASLKEPQIPEMIDAPQDKGDGKNT